MLDSDIIFKGFMTKQMHIYKDRSKQLDVSKGLHFLFVYFIFYYKSNSCSFKKYGSNHKGRKYITILFYHVSCNKCSFVLSLFVCLHIHMHNNIYAETHTHMYLYFQVNILLVCNLGSFRGEI